MRVNRLDCKIEKMMPITVQEASGGETCPTSRPVYQPGGALPENPQVSYYRARYYDPQVGRFISEDPLGFIGGVDFYSYVLNRPIQVVDPAGLSPQDVQRIRQICHSCVQDMVKAGVRRPGDGMMNGGLNDQNSNQSLIGLLKGSKYLGCKDQAYRAVGCLDNGNAIKPFDANWDFSAVAWWAGFHTIVKGQSSDPNDPIVYCDPWRDSTWTAPQNPPAEPWPPRNVRM
jgi:RHS repeat-associated protein